MRRFVAAIKTLTPFFVLAIAFYLDGIFKSYIHYLNEGNNNGLPQFFLMVLVLLTFKLDNDRLLILYAFILGYLYDTYYMGVFGIYMILFPITVILISMLKNYIPDIFIFEASFYLIVMTVIHFITYIVGIIFRTITVNVTDYITYNLWPTLFFNIVLFIIIYLPLTILIEKIISFRRKR